MKIKIALKSAKEKVKKIKSTNAWQKMFVSKIDEEKLRQYQDEHRAMGMGLRIF